MERIKHERMTDSVKVKAFEERGEILGFWQWGGVTCDFGEGRFGRVHGMEAKLEEVQRQDGGDQTTTTKGPVPNIFFWLPPYPKRQEKLDQDNQWWRYHLDRYSNGQMVLQVSWPNPWPDLQFMRNKMNYCSFSPVFPLARNGYLSTFYTWLIDTSSVWTCGPNMIATFFPNPACCSLIHG